MRILMKAHVKGHFRNGKWIKDYDTSAPSAQPKPAPYAEKQHFLFGLFGHKSKPSVPSQGHDGGYAAKPTYQPKPKPKPEGYHPQMDDNGDDVPIYKLSHATPLEAFEDPHQIATVLPGGRVPDALHGVPFAPWDDAPRDLDGWQHVPGQRQIEEPDFVPVPGKKAGAGVIVQEADGRVWVIHPTNQFGGYKGSFPKGTVEDGLGLQASAIKEAFEESGLQVEITGHLMDVERTTSKARYYTARRVGGSPAECGWESQSVSLVPVDKLYTALNMRPDHHIAEKLGAGPKPAYSKPSWGSAKPSGATGSLF